MGALALRDVQKTYHASVNILRGIDLEIDAGEFLILVGPSGCGKSTLLNIIAGLECPTAGRIYIGERDVTDLPPKDRDIAMVFQSYALYPNMTVEQNIAFGLEIRGVPKPVRQETVRRVAQMLQIDHLLDRKPAQLSGGQRQRVAMGRALARNPKLFLFDEPLSNLDAKLRVEMRAEIKQLHHRTRTTTVYVTHDQVEAMTLGDRIAVMKDGVVQQFGTPTEIYKTPANTFVATFIGSPAMNLVPVQRCTDGIVAHGISLPLSASQRPAVEAAGQRALLLGVRPEHVVMGPDGVPGTLQLVEPTGPETYAIVDTPVGQITVRTPGLLQLREGDRVCLKWRPEDAHLFDADTGVRLSGV
jgi:multiple sugar transport system ATP-binding protein